MIARIWHGRTNPEHEEKYQVFLLNEGTAEYRETTGNRSAKVWKQPGKDVCHFWTVTEWDDIASVKAFAGEDFQNAKYYPEDEGILLEFEEHVNHYEVYDVSQARIKNHIQQLERTYRGGNWLAESFEGKLQNISSQDAFEAPIPGVHSVAEIVWHCIYWRTVLIERLQGNNAYRDETVSRLNFLTIDELKEKGWPEIRDMLKETQSSLIGLLLGKNDSFLDQDYTPGFTFDYVVEGTIQHDIYHLGQIGLVQKFLQVTGAR